MSGYPPRTEATDDGLLAWLTEQEPLARLVLEVDGVPCGHIRVIEPRPDLESFLLQQGGRTPVEVCLEIGQLFVAPTAREQGAGQALTEHAVSLVREHGRHALVAAIGPESTRKIYQRAGFEVLGAFEGADGMNTVMICRNDPQVSR